MGLDLLLAGSGFCDVFYLGVVGVFVLLAVAVLGVVCESVALSGCLPFWFVVGCWVWVFLWFFLGFSSGLWVGLVGCRFKWFSVSCDWCFR